jgi:hypothetical protein
MIARPVNLRVTSHTVGGNCTLRVEITLVSVETALCVWKLDPACRKHTLMLVESHALCINYTRKCHIQTHTFQNYTRESGNHTLRV